jgi:signal transduction histidine kinase
LTRPAHRTLSVYSGPVAGAAGQIFARLWMFRDLSKQRLLEAELLQAQKMEAIGRLAGGIAHDFNNLLTGILGNLTMAEMELKPGGDRATSFASRARHRKRAGELVTQLLGFSRRGRLNLGRAISMPLSMRCMACCNIRWIRVFVSWPSRRSGSGVRPPTRRSFNRC